MPFFPRMRQISLFISSKIFGMRSKNNRCKPIIDRSSIFCSLCYQSHYTIHRLDNLYRRIYPLDKYAAQACIQFIITQIIALSSQAAGQSIKIGFCISDMTHDETINSIVNAQQDQRLTSLRSDINNHTALFIFCCS